MIALEVVRKGGARATLELSEFTCFAAGYTGRDRAAVEQHIRELAEHGVPPPGRVPCCYPVLPRLLVENPRAIDVYGPTTSGEIEPVLVVLNGRPRYLGAGSDHTDRDVERYSVARSKQLCLKVVSTEVWEFEEVDGRWDELELESRSDGEPYQSASAAALLPVDQLISTVPKERRTDRMVIFCGTVPLVSGLKFGSRFSGSLRDPLRGRSLTVAYEVRALSPID